MKKVLNIAKTLVLALLATFLVVSVAAAFTVWRDSNFRTLESADAIVVLGAAQYAGKPSPVLKNRLDTAAEVFAEGYAPVILTVGSNLPGDTTTEAEAGRAYLLEKHNLEPERVVAITEGEDTLTSIQAIDTFAQRKSWKTLILISDSMHSARVKTMAESFGYVTFTSSAQSGPGSSFDAGYFAKESLGIVYFWISRLSGTQ